MSKFTLLSSRLSKETVASLKAAVKRRDKAAKKAGEIDACYLKRERQQREELQETRQAYIEAQNCGWLASKGRCYTLTKDQQKKTE